MGGLSQQPCDASGTEKSWAPSPSLPWYELAAQGVLAKAWLSCPAGRPLTLLSGDEGGMSAPSLSPLAPSSGAVGLWARRWTTPRC